MQVLPSTATLVSDVTGAGLCNGSATATPAGGVSPYSYSWDNGETTATASALCAGNHCVIITDASGCTTTACITINEPGPLSVTLTPTDLLCNGICTGSVISSATGGVSPYTYVWSNSATSQSISNVCAGTYDITVTDANGNTATASTTVNEPTLLSITSASGTDPLCNGSCDGTLTGVASGGTGTILYTWTGIGSGASQTNVCSGNYTLTVTDDNSCTSTTTVTLNDPPLLNVSTIPTDAHCNQSDGSADAIASGGTAGYTYEWFSDAALTSSLGTGTNLPNVAAGTYYVSATDANGCTANTTATVGNLSGPTATAIVNSNVTGNGLCNGNATVTAGSGTAPYTYLWDNGETTATASALCAGTFCVTITDANGCTVSTCVTITEPAPLAVTITPVDLVCNGICNGSASSTPTGGVAPYTYSWSNGATTANINNLCAGTYDITVTDANGNTASASATINEPPALSIITVNAMDANCFGSCDGSVAISATGGTGTVQYNWTGIGTGASQTGLCAGTYNVTVFDDNGCTITSSATVNEPTPMTVTLTSVNANCGQADGSASATVSGGTPPYVYSWTSGGNAATENNLSAGSYDVTVTDGKGCTVTQTITVGNNPAGTLSVSLISNVSCNGGNNGELSATMTGGAAPFTYSWNSVPVQTTATATNLTAGNYTITVTDANGCMLTDNGTVTEPTALIISANTTNVLCYSGNDGTLNGTANGGTTPYTIDWTYTSSGNSVGSTLNITGQPAGAYILTVTDANNCTETSTVTIYQPDTLVVSVVSSDVLCNGACNGSATATPTGGVSPYTYLWNNSLNEITPTAQQLCAQTYTVTITDANGCIAHQDAVINEPPAIVLTSTTINSNCGQSDGEACVNTSGGVAPYIISWPNGANTSCITNIPAGTYLVEIQDDNDCFANLSIDVLDNNGPSADIIDSTMVSCYNGNDGNATVNIVGGSGFFTVQWDANAANQTTPTQRVKPRKMKPTRRKFCRLFSFSPPSKTFIKVKNAGVLSGCRQILMS